jgi:hypothetical protein
MGAVRESMKVIVIINNNFFNAGLYHASVGTNSSFTQWPPPKGKSSSSDYTDDVRV